MEMPGVHIQYSHLADLQKRQGDHFKFIQCFLIYFFLVCSFSFLFYRFIHIGRPCSLSGVQTGLLALAKESRALNGVTVALCGIGYQSARFLFYSEL